MLSWVSKHPFKVLRPYLDVFQVPESDFQGYRPGKPQLSMKKTDSTLEIEKIDDFSTIQFQDFLDFR